MLESQKTVLILDGEQRSSLAVTRALGENNIRIYVGAPFKTSLAGMSKYCHGQVEYCNPKESSTQFIQDINKIIVENEIGVLFPVSDLTSFALLQNQNELDKSVLIAAPSHKQYFEASDKVFLTTSIAVEKKVPIPKSTVIQESAQWNDLASHITFPVIFKPRASILDVAGKLTSTSVKVVQNIKEGLRLIDTDIGFSKPFLVQEKIDGEGEGVFVLCNKGVPVVFFSHRRIREKPPWGGVSVLCESTVPDADIKEYAKRLLSGLNFHGVAMVEFKRDLETGIPYLMEINARFWGSLQLSVAAGVNFPLMFYQLMCNKSVTSSVKVHPARLRWLLGDLDSLMISLRGRGQCLKGGKIQKVKLLKDFLFEFIRLPVYQVFRWSDLNPFFHEFREYCKALVGK